MIHLLLLTHGNLGAALLQVAEAVLGRSLGVTVVGLELDQSNQGKTKLLADLFGGLAPEERLIALIDSFGGTPSNLILRYLEPGKVEIIAGVNLAILLYLAQLDRAKELGQLCKEAKQAGREAILVAGEFL